MLADINLLPKKDPRNVANATLYILLAFLAVIFAGLFIIQFTSANGEKADLKNQVTALESEHERLMADEGTESSSRSSVAALQSAVEYADGVSLDSVPVVKELADKLPERGFFKTFSYNDAGELTLSVQFDTNREAAYYLARLKESSFFTSAELISIAAVKEEGTEAPEEESNELPRSEAQYMLKLNPDYLQAESGESADDDSSS
ncbi:PilN domain-containing protein [Metabacillus idriensis]|uniref:PilN domain-containing protein n=1 Tax=Metabacillus idriensis TaxID=324768 RepID=UPI0017498CF2|nr:PilN domain-containing protein [Metabacillus idriensis]